ncbi:hypothetical protein ACNKHW_00825 [Shigella flexneri]
MLGGKIAPIFIPWRMRRAAGGSGCQQSEYGDVIDVYPYKGEDPQS